MELVQPQAPEAAEAAELETTQAEPQELDAPVQKADSKPADEDRDFFMEALKEKEEAKKYREEVTELARFLQDVHTTKDLKKLIQAGLIDEDSLVEASAAVVRERVEREKMTEEQKADLAYKKTLEEKAKKAEDLEKRIYEFERKEAEMKFIAQLEKDAPAALEAAGLPSDQEHLYELLDVMDKALATLDTPLTPTQAAKVLKYKLAESEKRTWENYDKYDDDTLYERIPASVRERLRKAEVARANRKTEAKQPLRDASTIVSSDEDRTLSWDDKIERRIKRALNQ